MGYDDYECLRCFIKTGCNEIPVSGNRCAICMECLDKLLVQNCETRVMLILQYKSLYMVDCFLCQKMKLCKTNITMCSRHAGKNAEKSSSVVNSFIDALHSSHIPSGHFSSAINSPVDPLDVTQLAHGDKVRWGREVFIFLGFLNDDIEKSIVWDLQCTTCYHVRTDELKVVDDTP